MGHWTINVRIQDKRFHDMYVSFHLENDSTKGFQLEEQTNVFGNLWDTRKILFNSRQDQRNILTFVHLYNHPRISSFPLATDGVVDCICNGWEWTGGGIIPLLIVLVLAEFCIDVVINVFDWLSRWNRNMKSEEFHSDFNLLVSALAEVSTKRVLVAKRDS